MRFKIMFYFLLAFSSSILRAEIMDCSCLSEVSALIPRDALVFMEVDNVLLRSETEVAKTEFLHHLQENLLQRQHHPDTLANKTYPTWVKIQQKAKLKPTYQDLVHDFNQIKAQSARLVGLTHRGPGLCHSTLDQLHQYQLYFCADKPFENQIYEPELSCLYEGVLFVHPACHIGEQLDQLLSQGDWPYSKIVYVDYKLINLVEVDQVMQKHNIPFLGIYLRGFDQPPSQYTVDIGQIQLQFLDQIISDEIAKVILGRP